MALTVPMPVDVVGVTFDAVEITAGQIHTCARRATGAVLCWGDNTYGQLGNGSTTASAIPVAVAGIADAVELTSGAYHVCARMAAGRGALLGPQPGTASSASAARRTPQSPTPWSA